MLYHEFDPPDDQRAIIKLAWTLDIPAHGPARVEHVATPDGCMEIIRRLSGRSRWQGEQPTMFAAGIITEPARLQLSARSSFIGVRLWPWAWRLLTGQSPAAFLDHWHPVEPAVVDEHAFSDPQGAMAAVAHLSPSPTMLAMRDAVSNARTVNDLQRQARRSPRSLQRWFSRQVGLPPRQYLRRLRFSDAFARLGCAEGGLAGHAADYGFADQAHMAREFRSLAGEPAGRARGRVTGPFLGGK